jgi:hypothetical protein
MTSDKRNSLVVVTLVTAMTAGLVILLGMERWAVPERPVWDGNPFLMAERGLFPDLLEVAYVPSIEDARALQARLDPADSICAVYCDRAPELLARGSRVHVLVIGAGDGTQPTADQLAHLLTVLGELGAGRVTVQLAPDSDPRVDPQAPLAAAEILELLARKQIITE